jgi:hypothetical protein
MTKETLKRWIISTFVTFFAGFAIVFLGQIDNLTLDSLRDGTLVGLTFAGIRAGVKLLLELFVVWYNNNKNA